MERKTAVITGASRGLDMLLPLNLQARDMILLPAVLKIQTCLIL